MPGLNAYYNELIANLDNPDYRYDQVYELTPTAEDLINPFFERNLAKFFTVIAKCRNLQKLTLDFSQGNFVFLDPSLRESFSAALRSCASLQDLSLQASHEFLGRQQINYLSAVLRNCPLRKLTITMPADDDILGWQAYSDLVAQFANTLEVFSFDDKFTSAEPEAWAILSESLRTCTKLSEICVNDTFVESMKVRQCIEFCNLLSACENLQSFVVPPAYMDWRIDLLLLLTERLPKGIRSLSLANCSIAGLDDDRFALICDLISRCNELQALDLSGNDLRSEMDDADFDIKIFDLPYERQARLLAALRACTQLRQLNVSGNYLFSPETFGELYGIIKANSELDPNPVQIETLILDEDYVTLIGEVEADNELDEKRRDDFRDVLENSSIKFLKFIFRGNHVPRKFLKVVHTITPRDVEIIFEFTSVEGKKSFAEFLIDGAFRDAPLFVDPATGNIRLMRYETQDNKLYHNYYSTKLRAALSAPDNGLQKALTIPDDKGAGKGLDLCDGVIGPRIFSFLTMRDIANLKLAKTIHDVQSAASPSEPSAERAQEQSAPPEKRPRLAPGA